MKLPSGFAPRGLFLQAALIGACVLLASGCQMETLVPLSPPMHARVLDGTTKLPLDNVRVTLISRDAPETITAFSDRDGFVDMPSLMGDDRPIIRHMTDTPRFAVRAIFERRGYETYTIDSVEGYGFFKGYTDVHLYPTERHS